MRPQRNRTPGIRARHRRTCSTHEGGRCNCTPAWEAWVFSKRDRKKIRKTFPRLAEAKLWRADAAGQLSKGIMRAPKPTTIAQAWESWHEDAKAGIVRTRSGEPYKPSTLRSYEKAMRLRVLPEFGDVRQTELERPDLQEFVERLIAHDLAASTVQGTLLPVRAISRRAIARGELVIDPCAGLQMPSSDARRERFATPAEAEALLEAAPKRDRALWATALYAGLRRGELLALRWERVDLAGGLIHVRKGWDLQEGEIELKTRSGRRKVPIIPALRDHLLDHKLLTGRDAGFVFGRDAERVFEPRAITDRADKAWEAANDREREEAEKEDRKAVLLARITPHECRHTFASLMIAAGVNAKALSTFMGHANISITLDRYGHLMPGSEAEAATLLHDYLAVQRDRAEDAARSAEVKPEPASQPS